MRSNCIKEGIARTPHRGLLMATGVSKKNMDVPFIGIASSFTDLVPGHIGMRDLERQIEKGIHSGGGQAFIFGFVGLDVRNGAALPAPGVVDEQLRVHPEELIKAVLVTLGDALHIDDPVVAQPVGCPRSHPPEVGEGLV